MTQKKTHTTQLRNTRKLVIRNLSVSMNGQEIIHGINLTIRPGEIHLLMGPNGSGKSTLCHALAGHPRATVTKGSITLDGQSLGALAPHHRAHKGFFLGFQQPVDIPGITIASFLRTAKNTLNTASGKPTQSPTEFAALLKETLKGIGMDERFGGRSVNTGLSGGEKKRSELLQMVVLEPRYAALDEFDSGLDVDALRHVSRVIKEYAKQGVGFLLISHNPSLNALLPLDAVHIMGHGALKASGGPELLSTIVHKGYAS